MAVVLKYISLIRKKPEILYLNKSLVLHNDFRKCELTVEDGLQTLIGVQVFFIYPADYFQTGTLQSNSSSIKTLTYPICIFNYKNNKFLL